MDPMGLPGIHRHLGGTKIFLPNLRSLADENHMTFLFRLGFFENTEIQHQQVLSRCDTVFLLVDFCGKRGRQSHIYIYVNTI